MPEPEKDRAHRRTPPMDRRSVNAAVKEIKRIPGLHAKYELLRTAIKTAAIDELARKPFRAERTFKTASSAG